MTDDEERLRGSRRYLLAFGAPDGPFVRPVAGWFDGEGLWTTAETSPTEHLQQQPACVVAVPAGPEGGAVVLASGRARVLALHDARTLALHGPALAGALVALAVKYAGDILDVPPDLETLSARWLPPHRVVLRIVVDAVRAEAFPQPRPGVAPPLPAVVPADIRRDLSGQRTVLVCTPAGAVLPGTWGAGFRLDVGSDVLPVGATVAVTVTAGASGLTLTGALDADRRLDPDHADWWRGWSAGASRVASPGLGDIQLPG